MTKLDVYDHILRDRPALNPPYLTRFGRFIVLSIVLGYLGTGILWGLSNPIWAEFVASVCATATLILGIDYTKAVMTWRAVQNGKLEIRAHENRTNMTLNAPAFVEYELKNHLPWMIGIKAIRLAHSDHFKFDFENAQNLMIQPNSSISLKIKGKTQAPGKGKIWGIGIIFNGITGIFCSETHVEQNEVFGILPCIRRIKTKSSMNLVRNNGGSKKHSPFSEDEIEKIRPWQPHDSVRRIFWRGYAKRHEFLVRQRSDHHAQSLLFFIDAGPHMSVRYPDKSSPLVQCLQRIAQYSSNAGAITIVIYDESEAQVLANHLSVSLAIKKYEQWLLEVLEWQPPGFQAGNREQLWSEAAMALYSDYKLYKQVDFSIHGKGNVKIDLKGLVRWATADLASEALKEGDAQKASDLFKMPYPQALSFFIRRRCQLPNFSLSPDAPGPDLRLGLQALKKVVRSAPPQRMIWISDFAVPLESTALGGLIRLIKKHQISLGVYCESMPEHCLNFNIREGMRIQQSNYELLKSHIQIL